MNAMQRKTHPLVIAAASSVIVFSAVGVAAVTGYLPRAQSSQAASAPETIPSAAATRGATAARSVARPGVGAAHCAECGVIEDIRTVQVRGDTSGLGAAAGGVTGAIIGNQIGRGDGRTVGALLGAAGGALAGNAIESKMNQRHVVRVTLRMDDGSTRVVTQSQVPSFAVGQRVRIVDGRTLAHA